MSIIRCAVEEVRQVVVAAFTKAGLSPGDASIVAEALLDAEATGRKGHGLSRVPVIVKRAAGRGSDAIRVARDTGMTIEIHAHGALGYLAAFRAAQIARERLATQSAVIVGCHHTSHAGAIGYYARLVAEAGHWALAMADCMPLLIPYGGKRAVYGTNPIAFACPGTDHPLVADLSPGLTTYGAIMNARHAGTKLPEGVAMDGTGNLTTDPHAALDGGIVAADGAKGSALAFLVQAISGALSGAAGVPEPGENYGFFLMGARLDAFGDPVAIAGEVTRLAGAVRDSGAFCPGDQSASRARSARAEGMDVDAALWKTILDLG